MHTCIVFSPKYFCSSSLFGDNKTLLTAAHCLVEVTKENVNQKMNEPLSLMVLDGNGKLLVHSLPTNSSDRSTLLLWGPNYQRNEFSEIKKTIKETQTDFALIRLPTTLPGTPFIFSKDDTVEKDSQIISLGFPGPTNGRRENYQALDSDGVNVVASFGFFLGTSKDNPELRAFLGSELIGPRLPESASPIEQYAFIFDHTWISDMDCHQGMSGGPVINENGKLIGVVSRELLAMSNTGREISSSMARPMASISVKLKEYASVLDLISSQEKDQEMHIPRIVIVGETLPHIDLQNIPRELRKAGDPMADIAPITRDTNFSRNR